MTRRRHPGPAVAIGGPVAAMVVVNAAVAKALNCLMADAFLKIQAQQEATERLIQGGRKSWTRDEMRMLAAQLDQTLLYRWAQFNQVAVCVAATTAFGAICGAADWYAPRPDRFDCRHLGRRAAVPGQAGRQPDVMDSDLDKALAYQVGFATCLHMYKCTSSLIG